MNERIKELAVTAKVEHCVSHVRLQEFAELIVEECIAQCWSVSELEHNGYVVSECSKRVRKHFGVEE